MRAFFELKHGAHPCYAACRALGLAGALRQEEEQAAVELPSGALLIITFLRFMVGAFGAGIACVYPLAGMVDVLSELWGEELWFKILICFSAAIPYSILGYLAASEMIRSLTRTQLCVANAVWCAFLLGYGAVTNMLQIYLLIAIIYLLHVAVAFASSKFCGRATRTRSRVALLCESARPSSALVGLVLPRPSLAQTTNTLASTAHTMSTKSSPRSSSSWCCRRPSSRHSRGRHP